MNKTREDKVIEFHTAFNDVVHEVATVRILQLRKKLITEEVKELCEDIDSAIACLEEEKDVPQELWANMLKEMADVQVVLSGTSASLRPLRNLDVAFERVCASNMSKLGVDGKPIVREDGKILKGPDYAPPDLNDLI